MPIPIIVQYNIPRYVIGKPGRQNHACTGEMSIVPGLTHPFEFIYTNTDGVPINLTNFTLRLSFWFNNTQYELLPANLQGNLVFTKDLTIDDPYTGRAWTLLTCDDTLTICQLGRPSLYWSIYLIDDENPDHVFATQITSAGEPYGICHIQRSGMPSGEMVRSTSTIVAPS
jgi:hypothetical protein